MRSEKWEVGSGKWEVGSGNFEMRWDGMGKGGMEGDFGFVVLAGG